MFFEAFWSAVFYGLRVQFGTIFGVDWGCFGAVLGVINGQCSGLIFGSEGDSTVGCLGRAVKGNAGAVWA